MSNAWRSRGQIILLVLSLLGVGISLYLTAVHYQGIPLACSSSGLFNCEQVLSSSYSVVPGTAIPISVPGLCWFIVSAILAFIAWRVRPESRSSHLAEVVWTVLGMLTIFYLVYVEIVRLHHICIWCTSLHIIIFIMFLLTLLVLQRQTPEDEEFDGEGDEVASPSPVKEVP